MAFHSEYVNLTETKGCQSAESTHDLNLSDLHSWSSPECKMVDFSNSFTVTIGFVGVIMHSYILFCYNYRKFEPLYPTQMLLAGLSVFDLAYCWGLLSLKLFELFPNFLNSHFSCTFYFTFVSFNRHSVYLVVLLLAANRYYAICMRPQLFSVIWSNHRVLLYMLGILLFALIESFINHVKYCLIDCVNLATDTSRFYLRISLLLYIAIFAPLILIIIFLNFQIQVRLKRRIAETMEIDKGSGLLDYELQFERSYLRAVSVSTLITLPLLLLEFAVSVATRVLELHRANTSLLMSGEALMLTIFSLLYLLNPVVFFTTNEDFKLKMLKPVRKLRDKFDSNAPKYEQATLSLKLNY